MVGGTWPPPNLPGAHPLGVKGSCGTLMTPATHSMPTHQPETSFQVPKGSPGLAGSREVLQTPVWGAEATRTLQLNELGSNLGSSPLLGAWANPFLSLGLSFLS